jgi:phage RecT family recombinase
MSGAQSSRDHAMAIQSQLDRQRHEIESLLPSHIPFERFKRIVMTAINMNPELLTADRRSLFIACQRAAADGLIPDNREAAFVVYKHHVQYLPMIGGLRKLALQSGEVTTLTADCVYEGDEWEYWIDDNGRHIRHVPGDEHGNDDKHIRAAYAIARLGNGGTAIAVLGRRQLEKRRSMSRRGESGPWDTWFPEMAMKSVVRTLSRELPRSYDRPGIHDAIARENVRMNAALTAVEDESPDFSEVGELPPPQEATASSAAGHTLPPAATPRRSEEKSSAAAIFVLDEHNQPVGEYPLSPEGAADWANALGQMLTATEDPHVAGVIWRLNKETASRLRARTKSVPAAFQAVDSVCSLGRGLEDMGAMGV